MQRIFENVGGNQFKLINNSSPTRQPITEMNNVYVHKTKIHELGKLHIPDPMHGDIKLNVFPFVHTGKPILLPEEFKKWEPVLNAIMKRVPLQEGANQHYVTIDSKFFVRAGTLRREGAHVDGNFCVDPKFVSLDSIKEGKCVFKEGWGGSAPKSTWGGATPKSPKKSKVKSTWGGAEPKDTWGGAGLDESAFSNGKYVVKEDNSHVKMDWVLPYKIAIPIGDYISESKGGIFAVSSEVGCVGWQGEFRGEILSEGAFTNMLDQLTEDKKVIFESHKLYFMTSNTPHESIEVPKGKRRTFMRITLNHEYQNKNLKLR